jgi:hypothetical protein
MYIKICVITISILSFCTAEVFSQSNRSENSNIYSSIKPNILSRQDWRAKNPIKKIKQHKPSYITIHHTASLQNRNIRIERKMQNLQKFSQTSSRLSTGRLKLAWADVPYHFYIDVNGQIAEGRDIIYSGDTNTDYDPTGHIQVVLEGNFVKERPSTLQLQSLNKLVFWLANRWQISPRKIKGHKYYASTACPGKNLESKLFKINQKVTSAQQAELPASSIFEQPAQKLGKWFVILGSYPKYQRTKAYERQRYLTNLGYTGISVKDTENYPNLRNGLVIVTIGPLSKENAIEQKQQLISIIPDAYVKSGY